MAGRDAAPNRVPFPPSTITGPLYLYLSQLAEQINAMPTLSYTSYTGGPNSNLTGGAGDLCVNIVASAQTARLYVKEQTSGKTGWVSLTTAGGIGTAIAAQGTAALVTGAVKVSTAVVTSAASIFLTDAGGGVLANIGSLYVNGVTSGVSFAIASSNALDSSVVNWFISSAAK